MRSTWHHKGVTSVGHPEEFAHQVRAQKMLPQAGTLVHPDLPQPRAARPWLLAQVQSNAGISRGTSSTAPTPLWYLSRHSLAVLSSRSQTHSSLNTDRSEELLETESMWPQQHIQPPSAPSQLLQRASRQEDKQQGQKKTFFTSIPRKVIDTHTD